MREALQQKIDDLGTRINDLRDQIEDAAELRDIESEYLQAKGAHRRARRPDR